ncbi:MAG: type II toxin-antitoxin system RelE/ParE family toxin [Candidatus Omnitrophica bacterium]|nr:type II toxin-antitoxin system RelE/ParE family toxin [Candidatus Omnitrophota bacterium]
MYQVIFYTDKHNSCPVDEFLDRLQPKVRAKVEKWIEKLETEGPNLPRPYADVLRNKIRELRTVFSPNHYRLLYFFLGKYIIITHGFIKKTDKIPEGEIIKAEELMKDFLKRHKEGEIKL